jgi:hypothetical protein
VTYPEMHLCADTVNEDAVGVDALDERHHSLRLSVVRVQVVAVRVVSDVCGELECVTLTR